MIRILPEEVVNRIAAGEVVERPMSVVKELVENSLDAGATRIVVEVASGGKKLIKVVDNGCGIPPSELSLAFARHGTSKISSARDLEEISTLGFRGEALPSIASVAKVTVTTRQQGAGEGTSLQIQGGSLGELEVRGAPFGTTIIVEDLFYNTPARRKFLKTDATESLRITHTLMAIALANPHVSFTLIADGRETFSTTGTGSLKEAVARLFNPRLAQNCLPVEWDEGWVKITGLIGSPETARSTRQQQFWALGSRPIDSALLKSALDRAYDTYLPKGQYPFCALTLHLEPHLVDVNVHPAKREVRFREEQEIYRAVVHALRDALTKIAPKDLEVKEEPKPQPEYKPREFSFLSVGETQSVYKTAARAVQVLPKEEEEELPKPHVEEKPPEAAGWPEGLVVLGQAENLYIIAAGSDGLYLVDQHAAHERIRYEELQRQEEKHPSQLLLVPQKIDLGVSQTKALHQVQEELAQMGFVWEDFGSGSVLLRAVPVGLQSDPEEVLSDFADWVLSSEFKGATPWRRRAKVLATMACHSAVRAGAKLSPQAMAEIVEKLGQCQVPRSCPHGRPTMLKLSWSEVNRHFQR